MFVVSHAIKSRLRQAGSTGSALLARCEMLFLDAVRLNERTDAFLNLAIPMIVAMDDAFPFTLQEHGLWAEVFQVYMRTVGRTPAAQVQKDPDLCRVRRFDASVKALCPGTEAVTA